MEESTGFSNTLRYKQVQAQAIHEVKNQVKHWYGNYYCNWY